MNMIPVLLSDIQINYLDRIVHDAMREIIDQDEIFVSKYPNLTLGDRLIMTIQFRGVNPINNQNIFDRTLLMTFDDPFLGRSYFHTTTASKVLGLSSPFNLILHGSENGCESSIEYDFDGLKIHVDAYFHGAYGSAYDHYFPHVTRHGQELPFNITINPYHTCAEGCSGCSRRGTFTKSGKNYIQEHLEAVHKSYQRKFPDYGWENIKWIAIITGCQPTAEQDVQMFLDVIDAYRQAGGINIEFCTYTSHINNVQHMEELANAGVKSYVRTVECINDEDRKRVWGQKKGLVTLEKHLELLREAQEYFPIIEASIVLGTDSIEELIWGIEQLGGAGAAILAFVPRIYELDQLNALHPDVKEMGMHYFYRAFDKIMEVNSKNLAQATYLRTLIDDDLKKIGLNVVEADIPRRYRITSDEFEQSPRMKDFVGLKLDQFKESQKKLANKA